ncbi:DUF4132 domain-containing protein [Leptolyngbyaceae cyanobacterium CCMR0082]|uniref:DUF4132 domain-containing protein n=1 Tax=Adonisia turfae CCMR0082 TaxID=2304604 RepID=A0A6M0SGX0_9CYAN|nr:DUF4132 domain-containing protein [Adonisia turfae]NEZ66852.1 DUF4132 domain-containing protein [Adonisia turfae CCMR0082]
MTRKHFDEITSAVQLLVEEQNWQYPYTFQTIKSAKPILAMSSAEQVLVVIEIARQLSQTQEDWQLISHLEEALFELLSRRLPIGHDDLLLLLELLIEPADVWDRERHRNYFHYSYTLIKNLPTLVNTIESYSKDNELTSELQSTVGTLCSKLEHGHIYYRREISQLRIASQLLPIVPGEAWSDVAISDLLALSTSAQSDWKKLLIICANAKQSKPSAKWKRISAAALEKVGHEDFCQAIVRWFPLVDKPRTQPIRHYEDQSHLLHEVNVDILKGLVWLCTNFETADIVRAVGALGLSAYRRVKGVGERCVRLGNACVWCLGQIPTEETMGQLAILKAKVKYRGAQREIAKALTVISNRTGQSLEALTEEAVPTYGLSEVGKRQEQFGDFTATLSVVDTQTIEFAWYRPDGKRQKSVPKFVKEHHPNELKALKQAGKDIKKLLSVQCDRIESSYLQRRTWTYATWCKNYLNHPLIGILARRLIWQFHIQEQTIPAIWWQGQLVTTEGKPLEKIQPDTTVDLWHPLNMVTEQVLAWRSWLLAHRVKQPFKQAHREIYLLTDAEKTTNTYSNRFAAHIIKQHQFNSLCRSREWENYLILSFDCREPGSQARRQLSEWSLQAEFWVEAIVDNAEDPYGAYPYLSTDQVRFYTTDTPDTPISLSDVPKLVFSEVLRDVDLFVGVASIGNDPNWRPGQQQERYNTYWQSYSFGQLSETAKTRRQLFENLIPRLKIADCCHVTERFLVVQGKLRTYKIHLGSGNILMEPNDQYLCIVPGRTSKSNTTNVFLPFEGDGTTAIILSKAFLLAADDKINDPTIVSQLKLRSLSA